MQKYLLSSMCTADFNVCHYTINKSLYDSIPGELINDVGAL